MAPQPRLFTIIDAIGLLIVHVSFAAVLAVVAAGSGQATMLWRCASLISLAALLNSVLVYPLFAISFWAVIGAVSPRRHLDEHNDAPQDAKQPIDSVDPNDLYPLREELRTLLEDNGFEVTGAVLRIHNADINIRVDGMDYMLTIKPLAQ